jgi:hypothetical protein
MDGRIAHQIRVQGNSAINLALEGLEAGIYYIHITSGG